MNVCAELFPGCGVVDEDQRHRNEVKLLADMETDAQRAVYLEGEGGVRDHRGAEATQRLRRDVWAELKRRSRPAKQGDLLGA